MAEPWKRYLYFVILSILILGLVYISSGIVVLKIVGILTVVILWPFFGIYAYLLVKKDKEQNNE